VPVPPARDARGAPFGVEQRVPVAAVGYSVIHQELQDHVARGVLSVGDVLRYGTAPLAIALHPPGRVAPIGTAMLRAASGPLIADMIAGRPGQSPGPLERPCGTRRAERRDRLLDRRRSFFGAEEGPAGPLHDQSVEFGEPRL